MYESVRALLNWNSVFQDVLFYYRNCIKNTLGGMQTKAAVEGKVIGVFFIVLQISCNFKRGKFPELAETLWISELIVEKDFCLYSDIHPC